MNFAQIGGNHSQYPTQNVDRPPSCDNQVICIRSLASFLVDMIEKPKGVSPRWIIGCQ